MTEKADNAWSIMDKHTFGKYKVKRWRIDSLKRKLTVGQKKKPPEWILLIFYEEKTLVSEKQYGFRSYTSTEDAIRKLIKHVSTANENYILGVFVDFFSAFNSEWKSSILKKLRNENLYKLTVNLTDRTFIMTSENKSLTWTTEQRCSSIKPEQRWKRSLDGQTKSFLPGVKIDADSRYVLLFVTVQGPFNPKLFMLGL